MPRTLSRFSLPIVFAFAFPNLVMPVQAQVVPGSGIQVLECYDDFEDPTWSFTLNLPKGSAEKDKQERHPSGFSANGQFLESLYRGTPDFVRRVETPPGGLPGSTGALAIQTLHSGIPGQLSYTFQQDDLIPAVLNKLGYSMPVSATPSYVCRVYMPPLDKWERRHGSHFGYRADCITTISTSKAVGRFFKSFNNLSKKEQYWPGFFVQFNLKEKTGQKEDYGQLVMRGDDRGHEVPGPKITHAGWWTLGMSFTSDGKVHYYAREGIENLTARDHLYSSFPYGYKCEQTSCYFLNIVNQDDGHTWSTRFIIDDPKVYMATGSYRQPANLQAALNKPAAPAAAKVPAIPATTPAQTAAIPSPQPAAVQNKAALPASVTPAVPAISTTPAIPKLASNPLEIKIDAPKEDKSSAIEFIPPIPVPDTEAGNDSKVDEETESEETPSESDKLTTESNPTIESEPSKPESGPLEEEKSEEGASETASATGEGNNTAAAEEEPFIPPSPPADPQ